MKTNREEIVELFNSILQLCAFIGFFYLITNNIKQSIGLGYVICLFWWKLEKIAKNLKK